MDEIADKLTNRQQHLVQNPEWILVTCLNSLFNSMRLVHASRGGLIGQEILNRDFTLTDEADPNVGFRIRAAQQPLEPELLLENIMMNVAAACFMQFDEIANQRLGGRGRFTHQDENNRNSCTVLYLVRCAFAHNPLVPTWLIDARFRDRWYSIPSIGIELDTTNLHRQVGVIPRLGGWVRALTLLQHCHRIISPQTATTMDLRRQ